jgi:hypothetical protein
MVACLDRGNNAPPTIGRMGRHAVSGVLFPLLFPLLLGACTTIGHEKVAGWPKLAVYEHYVPHHEMRERCVKYTPWGMSPEACSEFNLVERRCDIWFSADFPPPKAFIEHERLHCEGYDHAGQTNMRAFLETYLAGQEHLAEQERRARLAQAAQR